MAGKTTLTGDFKKLWLALSVSLMGSEITVLALPLIAALTLEVSAFEMGLLAAVGQLPFLLCSLPAGVLIDRLPRRPVLITTDIGSALLLLTVPLSIPFGGPVYLQLCAVAFGIGTFSVISEVAHYAYVPTLVGREHLTASNSRLQVSHSASAAAGPGLGGILVQLLSAPLTFLIDAVSFLTSAVLLRSIRSPEPPPDTANPSPSLRHSLLIGLRTLFSHRLLRPIILEGATAVFFESGLLAIYVLYATRELGLSPLTIGLVFAAGGLGAIPGALLARWAGNRYGIGPAIIGGWFLAGLAGLLVPLAGGPLPLIIATLATGKALGALTDTVANIHQWSLRQAVTPDHLAGRVTASQRFIVYGTGAIGALTAGALGSTIGLRPTLLLCALGCLAAPLIALLSPLRHLHKQPTTAPTTMDTAVDTVTNTTP
ncbi:MFS transporter [Streptomyces sp. NPDC059568]|uniref:MFS transporter n=1 Tax=Streptomyces sp. NPDC059568 TaxID=3346868 RepID=UPI00367C05E8